MRTLDQGISIELWLNADARDARRFLACSRRWSERGDRAAAFLYLNKASVARRRASAKRREVRR